MNAPVTLPYSAAKSALAHLVRTGNPCALEYAAQILAGALPSSPALVPMPDLQGSFTASARLAQEIAQQSGGRVYDALNAKKPPKNVPLGVLSDDELQLRSRGSVPESLPEDIALVDAVGLPSSFFNSARAALARPDAVSASWPLMSELADRSELVAKTSECFSDSTHRIAAVVLPPEELRRTASVRVPATDDNGLSGFLRTHELIPGDVVRLRTAVAATLDGERVTAPQGTVGEVLSIDRSSGALVITLPVEARRASADGQSRERRRSQRACKVASTHVELLLSSFDPRATQMSVRYRGASDLR